MLEALTALCSAFSIQLLTFNVCWYFQDDENYVVNKMGVLLNVATLVGMLTFGLFGGFQDMVTTQRL